MIELVPSSLNRFREYKIGVVADIKKAFLQISVNKLDRYYLRFLWVMGDAVVSYRHCRVVFGLACSPFLLAAIIELLLNTALEKVKSEKDCEWSITTVEKLKTAFYVDNCVTSLDTTDQLSVFIGEAKAVMFTGCFDLRGWENSFNTSSENKTHVLGIS